MQYQKDEMKSAIRAAALQEFHSKGFAEASMRQIAKDAGTALGNLYKYFKSKEELFNSIVDPVYRVLMAAIEQHGFVEAAAWDSSYFAAIVEKIMPIFTNYDVELLLLTEKSKGTKYEDVKDRLIRAVEKELLNCLLPVLRERGVIIADSFIFHVIAATYLEGMFTILRRQSDEQTVRYLIHELLTISFNDIDKRFS